MKRKERVKRAIHFDRPDRLPISCVSLGTDFFPVISLEPKSWQPTTFPPHVVGGDPTLANLFFRLFAYNWKKKSRKKAGCPKKWWNQPGRRIDEWGIIWQSSGMKSGDLTLGHPVKGPLEDSWDTFDDYEIPDPHVEERYRIMKTSLWRLLGKTRYTIGTIGSDGIFHRCCHLRGFSNFLMDLARKPKMAEKLIQKVTRFFTVQAKKYFEYYPKLDSIIIADDLGTQKSPFISPKMFRKFISPAYKQLAAIAHENDGDFLLHSCGDILDLIPELIEAGVDALEFDSPHMTGVEHFKHFAEERKMAFWCCSNIQSTYINGTPKEVEEEVKYYIKEIGNNEGGLAIYEYPQNFALGTPKENIKAQRKAVKKWGNYNHEGVIDWLA